MEKFLVRHSKLFITLGAISGAYLTISAILRLVF
jgi:hypothetical protein